MNMKWQKVLFRNLKASFFYCSILSSCLWAQEGMIQSPPLRKPALTSTPWQEVAVLGAPTTGSLVEGSIGAIHKGCRHRFYCHSTGPTAGFLGPQTIAKPVSLKDQPGVFPAPLMGAATIAFNFCCQESHFVTPIVVRPDGTVFKGLPMTSLNSPQTLVISSPAQTGIYTLFILPHEKHSIGTLITVEASINTQPENKQFFYLKSFESNDKDLDLISAEFVYTPSN